MSTLKLGTDLQTSIKKLILDTYYPVGSIYITETTLNPNNQFGGTWEQIKDRFLLACGDIYSNGATGGEATHKLTVNEMPSHNHNFEGYASVLADMGTFDGDFGWHTSSSNGYRANGKIMNSAGGGQPHNNMPPYLAVYIWKRTS